MKLIIDKSFQKDYQKIKDKFTIQIINDKLIEFRLNIQTHYKDKLRVVVLDLLGNELININTQVNIGENELIIDSKKLSKNSFYYLRIFNSSNQEIANGKILK